MILFYKKKFIFVKYNHMQNMSIAENRTEYLER